MKYSLFLGCTIPARQSNYEISVRKTSQALGVELIDLDYGCCGFPVEAINQDKALAMSAVNLKKGEESGHPIITMCSACGEMLNNALHLLENGDTKKKVNKILENLETSYNDEHPEVLHYAKMLYTEYSPEALRSKIKKPLKGIKVATHPGCHYVRPKKLFSEFDDPEFPQSLDELVEATGAESIEYKGKTDCCGGGILAVAESTAKTMTAKKLETLADKELDALVLICPFCAIMFDKYQRTLEAELESEYGLPVIYYPQLLGLALGLPPDELGFDVNTVNVNKLLEKVSRI